MNVLLICAYITVSLLVGKTVTQCLSYCYIKLLINKKNWDTNIQCFCASPHYFGFRKHIYSEIIHVVTLTAGPGAPDGPWGPGAPASPFCPGSPCSPLVPG